MTELIEQHTANPTRKVWAGLIGGISGGSLATIFLAVIKVKSPETYAALTEVPEITLAVGSMFTFVLGVLMAYMTRESI